jgi:DNA-binding NarL/FixJ family response regulator
MLDPQLVTSCREGQKQQAKAVNPDALRKYFAARIERLPITPAQKRTLLLLFEGYTNAHIAKEMGTSEQVVKNRFSDMYDRTGASGRSELVSMVLLKPESEDSNG